MNKGKIIVRKSFVFLLAVILLMSFSATSFATASADPDGTMSAEKSAIGYGNFRYNFVSFIWNNPGSVGFETHIQTTSHGYIPRGYVGALARLFSSSGALVSTTGWSFNTTTTSYYLTLKEFPTTSGYYYSKGQVAIYNGDTYNYIDCYATPNYSPLAPRQNNNISVQRNSSGEIYGSELFLNQINIQPDLILAQGVDGTIGYVKYEDLDDRVMSPTEAIEKMENNSDIIIPLYESNGKTIIGEFIVSAGVTN